MIQEIPIRNAVLDDNVNSKEKIQNFKICKPVSLSIFMSPTEGEGDILFLVRILLALALALASVSARHFLVCTISHEPLGGLQLNLHGCNIGM